MLQGRDQPSDCPLSDDLRLIGCFAKEGFVWSLSGLQSMLQATVSDSLALQVRKRGGRKRARAFARSTDSTGLT